MNDIGTTRVNSVTDADMNTIVRIDDLRVLFHRLNNQLGILLANAELLETKAPDEASRGRAAQMVSTVLDAMGTSREIRRLAESADANV